MAKTSLVEENQLLTLFIPATSKAFVFRVRSRANRGFETLNYGPLPITTEDTLRTYDAGSATPPADGVLPARSYNPAGKSFPWGELPPVVSGDMWEPLKDYRERVFHVIQKLTPDWLRIDCQIPVALIQNRFMKDKLITGVDKDFGFARGSYETVHIPSLDYGYRWGNDSNANVWTTVEFTYGEYVIEVPQNAGFIFDILTRKIPSYWISLPINIYDRTITDALNDVYGFEGFLVYPIFKREEALREYEELLRSAKV